MSDEDSLRDALEAAIGQAIDAAVAQHEGGFVTKWVALIESVDNSGERGLWTFTSDEVKAWDTVGLLQHALHIQQNQTLLPPDLED